jgi:glycosyltransferase involved in cell wall biosynthesis
MVQVYKEAGMSGHKREDNHSNHVMFLMNSLAIGGSERKTVRIANALAKSGKKLTIAYLNAPHTLRDEILDSVDILFLGRRGKFSVGALWRLTAYVSQNKVDVLCCINLYPLIYAYLARMTPAIPGFKLLATTNMTKFVTHKEELQMLLYAPMLRRVDMAVFGSRYQKDLWVEKFKLNPSNCTYIYNGVDVDLFRNSVSDAWSQDIRTELGIPETGLIIGSIGSFRKVKQYEVAIQACVELREKINLDVYCLLVGGGPEEQRLRDLVIELQCDGYVYILDAADDVRPYLEVMDIFILSSISETFSNAALEAMAMALPVVLPGVGGCPEMVKSGVTGFIYEPGDLPQFVEQLSLLGADKERRIKMGQEARRFVEEYFRFEAMVGSYERLFLSPED